MIKPNIENMQSSIRVDENFKTKATYADERNEKEMNSARGSMKRSTLFHLLKDSLSSGCMFNQIKICFVVDNGSIF